MFHGKEVRFCARSDIDNTIPLPSPFERSGGEPFSAYAFMPSLCKLLMGEGKGCQPCLLLRGFFSFFMPGVCVRVRHCLVHSQPRHFSRHPVQRSPGGHAFR